MISKKHSIFLITATALALGTPTIASAGAESGFYIGGGVGDSTVEAGSFDESDTAYKAFTGFNFGIIPFIDVAVEASYADLGSTADVTAINAFGLVGFNFGPIGIFGKAGMADVDVSGGNSGTDPVYGIGAKFQFSSLAVRAEYEDYDAEGVSDLSMVSVSAVWTF